MYLINSIIILLGLVMGSFLNCLVWRLYKGEQVFGRSYCPRCKHRIAWQDNIPVLSFIALKGRCRYCKEKISLQYPLIEILVAFLFFVFWKFNLNKFALDILINIPSWQFFLELFRDFLAVFAFLLIFLFDLKYKLVPSTILAIISVFILVLNIILGAPLESLILGIGIAFLFFFLQYYLSKGRALGSGDIYIGVLMASYLADFKLLILSLFLSYLIGAIVSIYLMVSKKAELGQAIPLGVFLSTGALTTALFNESLMKFFFPFF